ncbi:MAG: glycine--tRNA ligase [archaeon]
MNQTTKPTIEELANFCKRKGFIYPSAEIYGGLAGFFDYGPLGVELKKNIIAEWWKQIVQKNDNIVGMDGAIISPEAVWQASGHTENFKDLILTTEDNSFEVRADQFLEEKLGKSFEGITAEEVNNIIEKHNLTAPNKKKFKKCSDFNLMFPVLIGAKNQKAYLRGETTQMIYLNYKFIQKDMRMKIPFGIAQIGKAFRNEISPRNFLFRCREFEQLEMQFFIEPKEADKWFKFWQKERLNFFINLGIKKENLRTRPHEKSELAHYAKKAEDIEYNFPFGWKEIEGIHNRGDWDLSTHSKHSGQKLDYYDEETKKSFIPNIIETSGGVERAFLTFLYESYSVGEKGNITLKLHPKLSPIKAAILPLVKKEESLTKIAKKIYDELKTEFNINYDETGSVGRRYARNDEIGTPFCVTIDNESQKNSDVTIRNRDDAKQTRVKIENLKETLKKLISGKIKFGEI